MMNLRRFLLLLLPVVLLGIGARVLRMRQPDVWKPNAYDSLWLSANGSRIVALDSAVAGKLRVWDVAARREMPVAPVAEKYRTFWKIAAVSPDGQMAALIATVSQGSPTSKGTKVVEWLEVWDIARAPAHRRWRVLAGIDTVATFANGRLVTSPGSAVKTYDANGKLVSKVQLAGLTPLEFLNPTAISSDGSLIIHGTGLRLFDARRGTILRRLKPVPGISEFGVFSFSPDNRFLVADIPATVASAPLVGVIWNVASGRLEKQKVPLSASWTAQGHGRVQSDGRVEDVVTRQLVSKISLPISGATVGKIQISLDGRVVVVQRSDGSVWIQNPRRF